MFGFFLSVSGKDATKDEKISSTSKIAAFFPHLTAVELKLRFTYMITDMMHACMWSTPLLRLSHCCLFCRFASS